MKEVIDVKNLHFAYKEEKVLKGVDLKVYPGDIVGIKGKNGAGKTTLLKLISGIIPTEEDTWRKDFSTQKILFVPNSPSMYGSLTGRENMELLRCLWKQPKKKFWNQVSVLSEKFSMTGYLDELVQNYSLGMRYKVYLAASLAMNQQILLMDEPLNAMDPEGQEIAIGLLKEFAAGSERAIVFSSHMNELISVLANRVICLENGVIKNEE